MTTLFALFVLGMLGSRISDRGFSLLAIGSGCLMFWVCLFGALL